MNPRKRFTEEIEKEIVQRYISGERSGALAKEYKCDRKMISSIAKRHGYHEYASMVKGGIRGVNTKHLNDKIVELHSENLSQQKIGDLVGISQNVVSRVLRQLNLKPNNPKVSRRGSDNNLWKGGRIKTELGYIGILSDEYPSMRSKTGYIPEHRLVMARNLNRPLEKWESVHHIDGNKENNDISNLQLRIGQHGTGIVYCCSECNSIKVKPIHLD
jgi:hypothetical protein